MRKLVAATEVCVSAWIDKAIDSQHVHCEGWSLVVDADRTLALPDTGRLVGEAFGVNGRIRTVFEAYGYSAAAFELVSEIWSDLPVAQYLSRIAHVAREVTLFEGWSEVFSVTQDRAPLLVVTSGIPQIWRLVLARHGFPHIPVLGGCHADLDEGLVNADTKRRVVEQLQERGQRVVAAGDSLIDESMLRKANIPIVVPDYRGSEPLRRALAGVDRVRLFCAEQRCPQDFQTITSTELIELLLPNVDRTHK